MPWVFFAERFDSIEGGQKAPLIVQCAETHESLLGGGIGHREGDLVGAKQIGMDSEQMGTADHEVRQEAGCAVRIDPRLGGLTFPPCDESH